MAAPITVLSAHRTIYDAVHDKVRGTKSGLLNFVDDLLAKTMSDQDRLDRLTAKCVNCTKVVGTDMLDSLVCGVTGGKTPNDRRELRCAIVAAALLKVRAAQAQVDAAYYRNTVEQVEPSQITVSPSASGARRTASVADSGAVSGARHTASTSRAPASTSRAPAPAPSRSAPALKPPAVEESEDEDDEEDEEEESDESSSDNEDDHPLLPPGYVQLREGVVMPSNLRQNFGKGTPRPATLDVAVALMKGQWKTIIKACEGMDLHKDQIFRHVLAGGAKSDVKWEHIGVTLLTCW
jgi:hypothetical protein